MKEKNSRHHVTIMNMLLHAYIIFDRKYCRQDYDIKGKIVPNIFASSSFWQVSFPIGYVIVRKSAE